MIQLPRILTLTAGLAALAVSGLVMADCPPADNCPPPVGTSIFDLADVNGGAIPHTYTEYTVNFTAIASTTDLAFALREDPSYFDLDDISVTLTSGGASAPNLVSDGNFDTAGTGSHGLGGTGWTYDNNYGVTDANGYVAGDCGHGGGSCWFDGAVGAYDGIDQNISTVAGQEYTLSFWLNDIGGLTTAEDVSPTVDGGGVADVLAYAGLAVPVEGGAPPAGAPEIDPASAMSALTLLLGGLTVLRGRKSTTQA